jgi:hypothetical protein
MATHIGSGCEFKKIEFWRYGLRNQRKNYFLESPIKILKKLFLGRDLTDQLGTQTKRKDAHELTRGGFNSPLMLHMRLMADLDFRFLFSQAVNCVKFPSVLGF